MYTHLSIAFMDLLDSSITTNYAALVWFSEVVTLILKILINFHTIISLCVGAGLHFLLVDKPDSIFLVVDKPDRQIPFIWVGGQSSKPKGENYDDDDDHDHVDDDDDVMLMTMTMTMIISACIPPT